MATALWHNATSTATPIMHHHHSNQMRAQSGIWSESVEGTSERRMCAVEQERRLIILSFHFQSQLQHWNLKSKIEMSSTSVKDFCHDDNRCGATCCAQGHSLDHHWMDRIYCRKSHFISQQRMVGWQVQQRPIYLRLHCAIPIRVWFDHLWIRKVCSKLWPVDQSQSVESEQYSFSMHCS